MQLDHESVDKAPNKSHLLCNQITQHDVVHFLQTPYLSPFDLY
jgi:hypothetical protein